MATTPENEEAGADAGTTATAPPEAAPPPAADGEVPPTAEQAGVTPELGKQLAPAPPAEEEPPKPQLCAGDRVVIQGMVEKEKLNGTSGILVAMTGDRWQVRLDGKGRWLLKTVHLVKVDVQTVDLRKHSLHIVGTFDQWKGVHKMDWDADCKCYVFEIKLGEEKEESFQILLDGDWKRCLHPDKNDANPYSAYNLLGPDAAGHSKNWTIGKHACDKAEEGARYRVSLSLVEDGNPKKVNWTKIVGETAAAEVPAATTTATATSGAAKAETPASGTPDAAAEADGRAQLPRYKKVCITGEFNDWKTTAAMMQWDESRRCYLYKLKLGYNKQESFQLLVDGEWSKCIHPDESDGHFRMGSIVCGPDDDGHEKNWTIGTHPLDKATRNGEYQVRLFLKDDGSPDLVDWVRLNKSGVPEPEVEPHPPVKLPDHKKLSIIGSWHDWKPQDMKWDPDRRCYHIAIDIGIENQESFQLWLDGESKKCLHPSCEDGSPFTENRIMGPDNKGHGKNWTIGLVLIERAVQGARFEIRLFLAEDGAARLVDWARIRPGVVGRAAR